MISSEASQLNLANFADDLTNTCVTTGNSLHQIVSFEHNFLTDESHQLRKFCYHEQNCNFSLIILAFELNLNTPWLLKNSLKNSFFGKKMLEGFAPRTPQYGVENKKKGFSKVLIFSLPLDFSLPRVLVDHFPKLYRWMFSTARCLYL